MTHIPLEACRVIEKTKERSSKTHAKSFSSIVLLRILFRYPGESKALMASEGVFFDHFAKRSW
jgi:hypothetical protein